MKDLKLAGKKKGRYLKISFQKEAHSLLFRSVDPDMDSIPISLNREQILELATTILEYLEKTHDE